jgi:hypothetical protein
VSGAGSGGKLSFNKKASAKELKSRARQAKAARTSSDDYGSEAQRIDVPAAAQLTVDDIMFKQAARGIYKSSREQLFEKGLMPEKEDEHREDIREGSYAPSFSRFPYPKNKYEDNFNALAAPQASAQTVGLQFNGATGPNETGAFPPDTTMGVGPSQVLVFLNGRIRTFNKTTGVADGVINADSDVFFASVMTSPGAGEVTFTSDPNARYDRISNRWFLNIIDVTLNASTRAITKANRVLLAVSDAGGNGVINASTVWTFYQFPGDATLFTDYQSFGIDASAIYIGADMFTLAGGFNSTKGFVIPKAPLLTGSALTVYSFANLVANASSAGPFAPRGVDNPDPTNTGAAAVGYFIGPDNAAFNTLTIRRVTNPGAVGAAPTISGNISIPTPLATRFPVAVPHLGNTSATDGRLDALDDRLFTASIRNGRLWTAHSIGVNNTGVAQNTSANNNRNAARWYEIQNISTTPTVYQSGTVYDNNATNDANQRSYWLPTIAVSGQGHAVLGSNIAGTNERVNAFQTGRLATDALGTMREGTGTAAGYTASTFAYNPAGDPGSPTRRWGDYSMTVVDPMDDMSIWTIQEFVNGTNTYGTQVAKLLAPPPATPAAVSVFAGQTSVDAVITGTVPAGSGAGFYDPGANLVAPARAFNHIAASVSGSNVVVNSVTYNSPTQVTLNLNTTFAVPGARTLTITNPDGQTRTGTLTVTSPVGIGKEADVSPRPSQAGNPNPGQSGDNLIAAGDVTQIRRFALGLDSPDSLTTNEKQKADCAPIQDALLNFVYGDGVIAAGDVTQARRYALGLDTPRIATGTLTADRDSSSPTASSAADIFNTKSNERIWSSPTSIAAAGRTVTPTKVSRVGNTLTVAMVLNTDAAQELANSISFTLNFNTSVLSNPTNIRLGSGGNSASLGTNENQVSAGLLGILLDLPVGSPTPVAGRTFAAGAQQLVLIDFTIAAGAPATTSLSFSDSPTPSAVSGVTGNQLNDATTFTQANIALLETTAGNASISGRIRSASGAGLAGVPVELLDTGNGATRTTFSAADGSYEFTGLEVGVDYLVTPKSATYSFSPSSKLMSLVEDAAEVDFTTSKKRRAIIFR